MAKTTRSLMAAVAAAAVLFAADAATASEPGQTRIVLRLSDSWQLPRAVLGCVQAEVTAIYDRIGVEVVWIASDESATDAHAFTVVTLSRERGLKLIKAAGVLENVMGQATNGSGYAYIFTHRVRDASLQYGVGFEKLLGKVIAHEIGHLLLRSGHSESGIMQPSMQVRTNASEWFTPAQGVMIRAELAQAAN